MSFGQRLQHGKKTRRHIQGVRAGLELFARQILHWSKLRNLGFIILAIGLGPIFVAGLAGAEPSRELIKANGTPNSISTNNFPHLDVRAFVVNFNPAIFSNAPIPSLSGFAGTNINLERIAQAASEALLEFQQAGYANANISISQEHIANGIVTMNVYQGAFPQILISGKIWYRPVTNITAIAAAGKSEIATPKTNAVPRFVVRAYEITGDTLLSTNTLMSIFAQGSGTNVALTNIMQATSDLQQEYRNRGYPTVSVTIPPQSISNGIVKIRVFEGRLSEILVAKNHYFSSNNVMRALPSLRTNMILIGPVFQAELDRANASQDRQIYPKLEPGAEPNTTLLRLDVKDRFPLHAKVDFNNENSPGTPELRVNSSAVYNNLWQLNHSLGVQYSFSPEHFKEGEQWDFYDRPLVANYSGFYRFPLGDPGSISEEVASQTGSFGYSEATRKFTLPPPSGVPEVNIYASRSTIDTGVTDLGTELLYNVPGVRTVTRQDSQQDLTINNSLGFRFSTDLPQVNEVVSTFSGGLDYKTYDLNSFKTNNFNFADITLNAFGQPNPAVISTVSSPVPPTFTEVRYLPLSIRWDGSRKDTNGLWTGSFGYSVNFLGGLFSNSSDNFRKATGSTHGDGFYHVLTASLGREQVIYKDWRLTLHADGQWASQPLISNEQFGIGGVGSVRGYHEGEVFGDTGWHVSLEQKTPAHVVGNIGGHYPLVFRGSIFTDYAEAYLVDPEGRNNRIPLWGCGLGVVASVGANWETRFLFSVPILPGPTIEAYQPYFNFSLTAQF